ncbi:MAG: PEP-CTERM sorting domain-containing protein [Planctomycetes bacterium]|nr:PEP-CTERM sorting domain-containing protein [Planctomycetota bacterium]
MRTRKSRTAHLAAALAACIMAAAPAAWATDQYWTNAAGGTFQTAANWNYGAGPVPGAGDAAVFDLSKTYVVTFNAGVGNQALTVSSGGNVYFQSNGGPWTYSLTTGGTQQASVLGGSTLYMGNGGNALNLTAYTVSVQGGSLLHARQGSDVIATQLHVGTAPEVGTSTFLLDGAGCNLTVAYDTYVGWSAARGDLTLRNGASGTLDYLYLADDGANAVGNLTVQSDADLNVSFIWAATGGESGQQATITVTGAGSSVTQLAASTLTLGAAAYSDALLNIVSGGAFTTGTGLMTVNKTGQVNIGAGGTLNAKGNIIVEGAFNRSDTGAFNWDAGWTMDVQNGGRVSITGGFWLPSGATVNINGTGSELKTLGYAGYMGIVNGSQVNVTDGGRLAVDMYLDIGISGNGTLVADGPTSTVSSGAATISWWGRAGSRAFVTFCNGAQGSFGILEVAADATPGTSGTVTVESGADLTVNGVWIGAQGGGSNAAVTVTGPGSSVTHRPGFSLLIGHESSGSAWLAVNDGASYTVDAGSTFLRKTGAISIDGGTVNLGTLVAEGGRIYLYRGQVNMKGNLTLGQGGPFAYDLTLNPGQILNVSGDVNLDSFSTLAINGGRLTTNGLNVSPGTFRFTGGLLNVGADMAGTFDVSTLGSPFTVGPGCYFIASNTAMLPGGQRLVADGGRFQPFILDNYGSIFLNAGGELNIPTTSTNQSPGTIFVGGASTIYLGGAMTNDGELIMEYPAALVYGPGALTNNGVIRGEGRIANPVTNAAAGEIWAEEDSRLTFDGVFAPNAGELILQGGTLEFAQPLTNAAAGFIAGRGTLAADAGISNDGAMAFSGGFSDVHGDLANNGPGKILVSGGATATFYDDVQNNASGPAGGYFRVSPGCAAVFLGSFSGSGVSGGGTVYMEGDMRPGSSPAAVNFGGDLVFGSAASLEIEIGGTTPGAGHDQVNVAGRATLDGAMNVVLIYPPYRPSHNDTFTVMTFASRTGTFDAITGLDLGGRLTLAPAYSATDLVLTAVQGGPGEWRYDQSGNASVPANWTGGLPNGAGDAATFGAVITQVRIVSVDAPTTVGALNFQSPNNYIVAGPQTLTLRNTGGAHALVNVDASGGGGHDIAADVTLAAPLDVRVALGAAITFSGTISNAGDLAVAKSGAGTLILGGSNTYGGGTTVADGTLLVQNAAGSATGSGAVTVGAATLGGTGTIAGPVFLTGDSTLISTAALTINGALTVSGEANQIPSGTILTLADVFIDPGAILIVNGTLGGGTGTVYLRGTLMGKGTIGKALSIEEGGTISPGAPSTILTMSQILDAQAPRNFSFEIGAPSPDYAAPDNSINDVLRLTDDTLPFADAAGAAAACLTSDTVIDVYFLFIHPPQGQYKANFFAATDFTDAIREATFQYWRLDPRGSRLHNGNFFSPLDDALVDWSVAPEIADFGGEASGYITQFTVIPEPNTLALAAIGGLGFLLRRRRT